MNIFIFVRNKLFLILTVCFFLCSCSETFLDVNTDPNNPSEATLDLLMPAVQVGYTSAFLSSVERASAALVDQVWSSTYGRWQLTESDFNDAWKGFYTQSLADIEQVIVKAEEEDAPAYAGIAKLQKAYIYGMMVDLWGDIPFSEALATENPVYDAGESIYPALFTLIDEGITDLGGDDIIQPGADMIYAGEKSQWIQMANSLKLKLYLQTRLVNPEASASSITAILNSGQVISDNASDFQFQFGSGIAPQNAHPYWVTDYNTSTRVGYHSNSFFVKLLGGSDRYPNDYTNLSPNVRYGIPDPRLRYYFYRQVSGLPDGHASIPCELNQIGCYFFYSGSGYLGRDRGDNSVGPADGAEYTAYGVYPAGGVFDADQFNQATVNDGTGQGIFPMITNFMMKFAVAEAILTLGVPGDARTYLEQGMRASIQKVIDFGNTLASPPAEFVPTNATIDAYVNTVLAKYDAADASGKLEVVMDQAYVAVFGNGIEAYNNYRRTGYPMLTPVVDNNEAGPFPNRLIYVVDEVGANANIPENYSVSTPVFWDK
ncbi:MAG: SusD/RagB family nutrient-binding outer membrane lipoprotein [Cyclobacteriaceae bacterium]